MFQAVDPHYYILTKGAYAQFGGKVHFTNAPGLRNFIAGVNYFHNNYTNQELDVETTKFTTYVTGGPIDACGTPANPAAGCALYNNVPVSYVPNVTLNVGLYYGILYHDHTMVEPRLWFDTTSSQHLWSNNTGAPTTQTMPSYTTLNLSFNAPITFKKQSFNLRVDMLNLVNKKYNEYEYISSGGSFASLNLNASGYINAYPGAPRTIYGTNTYWF